MTNFDFGASSKDMLSTPEKSLTKRNKLFLPFYKDKSQPG